ncbi:MULTISPECIES: 3-hydroxyacyl-CoA dehydrogenase NAD-binding domain-containing protein [unclassified Leisingera]|uniref:3-hydroxyacyl-CoA dehydrogenase NAD-binding domain-containing protein n=1 Tax=unclassified Leisingera TaxID=2614906 RepID=UPI0002EAD8C3|nr:MULTISPECIES: 3-hydroxyacyl-CoA dehydrogenase NAD-binding domain-containing protein [unclassified Leisingera]KIC21079.1 3-hydroxyacyl-CoA dehydrogenase [Leisingera sp. ANG-S3]KIC54004.1 3-hydroxyacyl-CoA dehydrogenase [Leisingera sp. ANG-S]KID09634.1 3-hydroxyacyl-CoA dehydrogenase [Leisingera sp. ANG1]
MADITHTAVLGAGTIGASWAALFLASGRSVAVYDPAEGTQGAVQAYIDQAWEAMSELGLTARGNRDRITFARSAREAVEDAGFIQENVPERLPVKHALFAEIEPVIAPDAIVASSASGLTLGQMQAGWQNPGRFILGHPFNPPHLIPLVEVMGNGLTDPDAVPAAVRFYKDIGKVTIRVKKEVPGHVANRLQAAVWREAIHLVQTGVASVGDVDKAMSAGPGLRWAAMGPTTLFSLGAGSGGLPAFCDHFADTFNGWWDDLGKPKLTSEISEMLAEGLASANGDTSMERLAALRDLKIVKMQVALASVKEVE